MEIVEKIENIIFSMGSANTTFVDFELDGFPYFLRLNWQYGTWEPLEICHYWSIGTCEVCKLNVEKNGKCLKMSNRECLDEFSKKLLSHPSIRLKVLLAGV